MPEPITDGQPSLLFRDSFFLRRRRARLAAVQVLYQIAHLTFVDGQDLINLSKIFDQFFQWCQEKIEGLPRDIDRPYFERLVRGAVAEQSTSDALIMGSLAPNWQLDRLENIVLAILRVGVHELKHMTRIPTAVLVNEYLEITHAFFEDAQPAFVHGIMNTLARNLRSGVCNEKT